MTEPFTTQDRPDSVRKVVAIASSAGGINALTQVLSRLPADLPAAVLIVQHLRDDRPTELHGYLARQCPLPVRLAENGMGLKEGVVYLALPGWHLEVKDLTLVLNQSEPVNYVRPAADVLFFSLAQAFGSRAMVVILSGTGRDGARGCEEVSTKGGMAIAQAESGAAYFDMPGAAIKRGCIDCVLPLAEIAGKIAAWAKGECRQDGK